MAAPEVSGGVIDVLNRTPTTHSIRVQVARGDEPEIPVLLSAMRSLDAWIASYLTEEKGANDDDRIVKHSVLAFRTPFCRNREATPR
jgi:hypothetical protein